jgi:hypothetical protein
MWKRREKRLIKLVYEQAEAARIVQLNEDEAGPYQPIPQPGASWRPEGHPALHPHEYERGGTAKLLTLFAQPRSTCAPKASSRRPTPCCIPGSKNSSAKDSRNSRRSTREQSSLPKPSAPRVCWEMWLGHSPRNPEPPLRIVLVLDNLAGHLSYDMVRWLFDHGVMSLYTPIGGLRPSTGRVGAVHHRVTRPGWSASQECARSH